MRTDDEGAGWFDPSWEYSQYDEIVTGPPLGPADVSDDGMKFTRPFENGTVWVDVGNGTYSIELDTG